jgi:hypothetical protein
MSASEKPNGDGERDPFSEFAEWIGLTKKEVLDYKRPVQLRKERDEAKRRYW